MSSGKAPFELDEITAFYDENPYPPPVADLARYSSESCSEVWRRVEHHRFWPTRPYRDDHSILVAGCGTSQAARYAIRYPNARVVGIDVSPTSIEHTRALLEHHKLEHLELRELPVERVDELGESFDQIVCTGVIHHLTDPVIGLRALSDVLAPMGVMHLMVYAPYGRTGVYMIQEYCRRLGIGQSPAEIADLRASLRELPMAHPLSPLLRNTPDFHDDGALADALLNPRDRAYSVPQLFDLLGAAGLQFGRWIRQAPYLPRCGVLSTTPHGERIAKLEPADQYAATELFRGTMTRHSLIACREDRPGDPQPVRFDDEQWPGYVPIRPATVISVEERLPPGAAAAVLNQAHVNPDLVLFVDDDERGRFDSVDGRRTIAEIGAGDATFFERLWEHDLVVIDASRAES